MKKYFAIFTIIACSLVLLTGCNKNKAENTKPKSAEEYTRQVNEICEDFGNIHTNLQVKMAQVDVQLTTGQLTELKGQVERMEPVLESIRSLTPTEGHKGADESLKKAGQYYGEGIDLLKQTIDTYAEKEGFATYEESVSYEQALVQIHEKFGLANNEMYSVVLEMKKLEQ